MQKLKAFTLMELLIGMIISSIVISFCYAAYAIIYKQYLNYKTVKQNIVHAVQFNTALQNDFLNAETIQYEEHRLFINNMNDSNMQYQFNDSCIVRTKNELTDTFKLAITDIIINNLSKSEEQTANIVDQLSFTVNLLGEEEHFHFSKLYSAETIMKCGL